jgi:hypothetical protein
MRALLCAFDSLCYLGFRAGYNATAKLLGLDERR